MKVIKLKKLLRNHFPCEAIVPLAFVLITQFFCYFIPKMFVANGWYLKIFDFTTNFDIKTPFIPSAIIIYFGCYAFWVIGIFVAYKVKNKKIPYDFVLSLLICHIICFMIYLIMPTTTNIRPDLSNYEGKNIFMLICKLCFKSDTPYNLFPSMHVTVTWFCYIAIRRNKDISFGYRLFTLLFSFAIFASILLTKQHYVWDILPSIILCEFVYFIVKRTKLSLKFKNLCFKINKILKIDKLIEKQEKA